MAQILSSLISESEVWRQDKASGDIINDKLGVEIRDPEDFYTVRVLLRNRGWLEIPTFSRKALWSALENWTNREIVKVSGPVQVYEPVATKIKINEPKKREQLNG